MGSSSLHTVLWWALAVFNVAVVIALISLSMQRLYGLRPFSAYAKPSTRATIPMPDTSDMQHIVRGTQGVAASGEEGGQPAPREGDSLHTTTNAATSTSCAEPGEPTKPTADVQVHLGSHPDPLFLDAMEEAIAEASRESYDARRRGRFYYILIYAVVMLLGLLQSCLLYFHLADTARVRSRSYRGLWWPQLVLYLPCTITLSIVAFVGRTETEQHIPGANVLACITALSPLSFYIGGF